MSTAMAQQLSYSCCQSHPVFVWSEWLVSKNGQGCQAKPFSSPDKCKKRLQFDSLNIYSWPHCSISSSLINSSSFNLPCNLREPQDIEINVLWMYCPMKCILMSAGVGEGKRDRGNLLISCYSVSWQLVLNLDWMVEAREPLLQWLNNKDKEPHANEGRMRKQKQLWNYSYIFYEC